MDRQLLDSYKKLEQTPNERNALLNIAMLGIYSNDFKVRKSFRFNLLNNFYTPLAKTNFSVFGQETLDSVNRWVNTKTHGRVKQILTAPLQPDTRLVLMTAFAFRADWLHEFERRLFIDREFHNADGSISRLPLMFRRGSYRYVATPNHSQLIELPYHGDFAMYILLPDKSMSLPALLGQLSGRKLDTMQSQMQNTSVELFLPRFRVEFGLQLVPVLQDMGVKRAFGPNADFSGISSSGQAYISTALHQAFVEVNEKGTEAVAATVIGVSIKSGGYATKMLVDRPFAFIIKDLQNNLDLFSGIITKL